MGRVDPEQLMRIAGDPELARQMVAEHGWDRMMDPLVREAVAQAPEPEPAPHTGLARPRLVTPCGCGNRVLEPYHVRVHRVRQLLGLT